MRPLPPRPAARLVARAFALSLALALLAPLPALAQGTQAVGTKEVLIDSLSDFDHVSSSQIKMWKGNDRVLVEGADPVGYYYDKADLSDPKLMLSDQTNAYISKITTQQRPTPNTTSPTPGPEVGELRLVGWKVTATSGGRATADVVTDADTWNRWDARTPNPLTITEGPSHPVGGLNYILQSFKVYKTGSLEKIRLKVRRHPGMPSPSSANPGLYVVILADDGSQKNPMQWGGTAMAPTGPVPPNAVNTLNNTWTYDGGVAHARLTSTPPRPQPTPWKDVVLGEAYVPDTKIGTAYDDGVHAFETVDVVFSGAERPMLVADKLYWMKISTMPYSR